MVESYSCQSSDSEHIKSVLKVTNEIPQMIQLHVSSRKLELNGDNVYQLIRLFQGSYYGHK